MTAAKRGRGRPPLSDGDEETVRLHVLVPASTRTDLERAAEQRGRKVSEVVRDAIDRELRRLRRG